MLRRLLTGFALVSLPTSVSCSDDGGGSGDGWCVFKEPGTEFAPCQDDSDCFSNYCDKTENPPYCYHSSSAGSGPRGLACSSSGDCPNTEANLKRGIRGGCAGSNIAQKQCSYVCTDRSKATGGAPGSGGAASSSGGSSSDTGGATGTGGGGAAL